MQRQKHTRNQNACDTCRSRRVKCRFTQGVEVCNGCQSLNVPCTSDRPRRKRGPPNRYAGQAAAVDNSQPLPPTQGKAVTQQSLQRPSPSPSSHDSPLLPVVSPLPPGCHNALSLLGSDDLVRTILDDWFEHIHPLAPILHRRRFLARLNRGDANNDPVFCGLVISIICATCNTLRRRSFTQYPGLITLDRCNHLIQTFDLLPANAPYSLDWCVAKYNLAAASTSQREMSDPWVYRCCNEAMTGTRYLATYRMGEMSLLDRELLKRLYCLLIITRIRVDMLGTPVLGRAALSDNLSERPHALTDDELGPNPSTCAPDIPAWHGDHTSYVPGLTHLLDIFLSWNTCQTDRFYIPADQVLTRGLARVESTLAQLPPELRWRGGLSRPQNATPGHDVQIANIFITSLYVRSNLLQQFGTPSMHRKEHQSIVSDLLEVLYHLPQPILEANGYSLIPKIRDIGGAYLEVLQFQETDAQLLAILDDDAKGKLERLLKKLGVLDFRPDLAIST